MFLDIAEPRTKIKHLNLEKKNVLIIWLRFVEKLPELSIKWHRKKMVKYEPQGSKFLRYAICYVTYGFRRYRTQNRNLKLKFNKA